jgi:hypothetical protein
MADEVNLYNVNDGLFGRDRSIYLDKEEQRIAEERRAIVEDREPDYDNLLATAGTVLVTAPQLVNAAANLNVPSQHDTGAFRDAMDRLVESDEFAATPATSIDLDALNDETEKERVERGEAADEEEKAESTSTESSSVSTASSGNPDDNPDATDNPDTISSPDNPAAPATTENPDTTEGPGTSTTPTDPNNPNNPDNPDDTGSSSSVFGH